MYSLAQLPPMLKRKSALRSGRRATMPASSHAPLPDSQSAEPAASHAHRRREKTGVANTRVIKTLQPGSRGTLKLQEQFGDQLVCVRYRHEHGALARYTTVELVVGSGPVRVRPKAGHLYGVHVAWGDPTTARLVKAAGGRWDPRAKLWRLDGAMVMRLGLQKRIRDR